MSKRQPFTTEEHQAAAIILRRIQDDCLLLFFALQDAYGKTRFYPVFRFFNALPAVRQNLAALCSSGGDAIYWPHRQHPCDGTDTRTARERLVHEAFRAPLS